MSNFREDLDEIKRWAEEGRLDAYKSAASRVKSEMEYDIAAGLFLIAKAVAVGFAEVIDQAERHAEWNRNQ